MRFCSELFSMGIFLTLTFLLLGSVRSMFHVSILKFECLSSVYDVNHMKCLQIKIVWQYQRTLFYISTTGRQDRASISYNWITDTEITRISWLFINSLLNHPWPTCYLFHFDTTSVSMHAQVHRYR